ncbi:MAG: hypothetical protein LBD28_01720 [Tannerellaceae bacterium]|jgi:hypothetical protein|nr:hypothetical protein [Tannerellaceae bacterium]
MDKGDLFYLIFAAIAAAISIYRGINKKRAAEAEATTSPSVPQEQEYEEEDEEEDNWLMPVEKNVQPEPVHQPESPLPAPRAFTPLSITPIEDESVADDELLTDRPKILSDADEVRKAFIYAEILNRKY